MNPTRLCLAARDAALRSPALVGFDPTILIQILNILLPGLSGLFTSCFGPAPTPASIKQHLGDVYSQSLYRNGTNYDNGTLRPAVRHATQAGRHVGHALSQQQAQAIAVSALDTTRTAADDVVQEELTAAAQ
jgi:hypothetical protein